jgi:hypothetical protein
MQHYSLFGTFISHSLNSKIMGHFLTTGRPQVGLRESSRDPDGGDFPCSPRLTPGHEPGRDPVVRATMEEPDGVCSPHGPGVNLTKLFHSSLTLTVNKLVCLSMNETFSLV